MDFCRKLDRFIDSVMADLRRPPSGDSAVIESAILDYYHLLGLAPPQILWFPNPWLLWFSPVFICHVDQAKPWKRLYVTETLAVFEGNFGKVLSNLGVEDSDREAFWNTFPVERLDNISLVVEQELFALHAASGAQQAGQLTELVERYKELVFGSSSLYVDFEPRLDGLNWYQIQHYYPKELIWENVFDRRFTNNAFAARVPIPPSRTIGPRPRGMEWGVDLRLQILLYEYASQFCDFEFAEKRELDLILRLLAPSSVFAFFDGLALVCQPVTMRFDQENRLHSSDGPAISSNLGFDVFAWHGLRVPARAITTLDPNIETIMSELDPEVVHVLIQKYGLAEFIRDSGIEKYQEDECGALYRMYGQSGVAVVFLRVKNSTPEPNGEFKSYFLRVPPEMFTAKDAVSWTFRLRSPDYSPVKET